MIRFNGKFFQSINTVTAATFCHHFGRGEIKANRVKEENGQIFWKQNQDWILVGNEVEVKS